MFWKLGSQQSLQTLVYLDVVLRHHSNGLARPSCASRTSNAMDVILAMPWQVKVDHDIDGGNIKTSRSYVRANENVPSAALELCESPQTLRLGHLTVQAYSWKAEVAEHQRKTLNIVTRSSKDEDGLAGVLIDEIGKIHVLVLGRNE